MKFFKTEKGLLILVLLIAAFLRFFHVYQWQFSYDELSALTRLNYSDLKSLFKEGIIPDGHPPFIQVFLYFYTKIFGIEEFAVKLPFAMCGVLSVYLSFRIGKIIGDEYCGLFSAAAMAVSQFFIYYSITARPYIAGLFFYLWFLLLLFERIYRHDKNSNKGNFLIALILVLASLTHHLALLSCVITYLVFWVSFHKGRHGFFIRTALYSLLLYSPNLPIFWKQLMKGGIGTGLTAGGWLGAPEYSFFYNFIFYLFQYSTLLILFVAILFIASFIVRYRKNPVPNPFTLPLLLTVIFTILVPFYYSRWVNPLLQFSGLIFISPLIFFLCFSNLKFFPARFNQLLLLLLIVLCANGLINSRKWFEIAGISTFHTAYQWNEKNCENKSLKTLTILAAHKSFPGFYAKKFMHSQNVLTFDDDPYFTPSILNGLIKDSLPDEVILGGMDPIYTEYLLQNNFEIVESLNCYGGEVVRLKKDKFANACPFIHSSSLKISLNNSMQNDSLGQFYLMDSTNEYDINAQIDLTKTKLSYGTFLNAVLVHDKPIEGEILLCFSILNGDSTLRWVSKSVQDFTFNETNNVSVLHTYLDKSILDKASLIKFFVWNRKSKLIKIRRAGVFVGNGNPYRYGLTEDF